MSEDIFAYKPITEWNNKIIEFGMPSTDGNTRLTEICLAAESCLEASNNATQLSFTDLSFQLARSSPVQKIIRTLFGEDTGIEIETFAAITDDGVAYFMSPMVTAAALLLEKDWLLDLTIDKMNIGFHPTYFVEYTGSPIGEKAITNSTWHRRYVLNPQADGNVTTGNRPITGNWDQDGEPYWEFSWEGISTGKCSDNVQTSQWNCENTVLDSYCREMGAGRGYCSNSSYNNNQALCLTYGTCSDPTYNNNELNCVINGTCSDPTYTDEVLCVSEIDPNTGLPHIWTYNTFSLSYTWKDSVGTPVLAMKANEGHCSYAPYDGQRTNCINSGNEWYGVGWQEANIKYYGSYYCTYADTYYNGNGRCWYSTAADVESQQVWNAYGTGWSEDTCKNYAVYNWPHLYWMWTAPGNQWNDIHAVWRPSTETLNVHSHYNIKTSDNYHIAPVDHLPDMHAMQGSTIRKYLTEYGIAGTWGNGEEIGRSSSPTWITNTFNWPNNDLTYDYCLDPGYNQLPQWSSPSGYNDETPCHAAGDCTPLKHGGWVHPEDQNNESSCLSWYLCSDASFNNGSNNSMACLTNFCCSNPSYGSSGSCTDAGYCSGASWANGNPYACNAAGYAYVWYGYTWGPNNCGRTWDQANQFTNHNNVWTAITPDIEVEIPIEPTYFWNLQFPAHSFVSTGTGGNSSVDLLQGYTSGLGTTQPNFSKIRWAPPQYNTSDYNRQFPRPTKFRIYRSPAWYNNLTGDTDYTNQIWKLAGEVTTQNDDGYHYFYDTREDMIAHGLQEYQHAYYAVTAVWEHWNWMLGFTIKYYNNLNCSSWDIHDNQTWTAVQNNVYYDGICSNSNYTNSGQSACENAGTCNGNSNYNDDMGGCLAAGFCTGNSSYHNNEAACLQWGTCSDPTYNNDQLGCTSNFNTWTSLYSWTSEGNWWQNAGYTWTIGSWSGSSNSSANLDNVENASPATTYTSKHVRINDDTDNRTYRASGYFRAPVSGQYIFQIKADDAGYVWLGTAGQTVDGPVGLTATRTWYNYVAAVPGDHGDRTHNGYITLVEGEVYPFLAYQANEGGPATFEIRFWYPDGTWNDGGNGLGEWKYVPFNMMPENMDPGMHGNGQTVEGDWASSTVPAWYTGFP